MRTAEQVRAYFLDTLHHAVLRPRMFGGNGRGVELAFRYILGDLCWFDERQQELSDLIDDLSMSDISSSQGVFSGLEYWRRDVADPAEEITSVYTDIAGRLGYLSVARRLPSDEWQDLFQWVRRESRELEWRSSDVVARFGRPSLNWGTVYAYAGPADADRMVFFDFCDACSMKRGPSYGRKRYPKPKNFVLRSVRLPAPSGVYEYAFTPHGRYHHRPAHWPDFLAPALQAAYAESWEPPPGRTKHLIPILNDGEPDLGP